jgi:V/A-type H+/Na+-transporting ATPase subunit I
LLVHAGMMLVVTSLMTMVGGSGSILVLVFGNIFVMGLEGMIVGIQVLRLEFYEMFSRYYEGNGVAFNALNL